MSLLDRLKKLETKLQESGTDILILNQLYDGTGEVEAIAGLEGRYTHEEIDRMIENREQGLTPQTHVITITVADKRVGL